MSRYRSPYSRQPRRRRVLPTLVVSVLGLLVIVLGLFVVASHLGATEGVTTRSGIDRTPPPTAAATVPGASPAANLAASPAASPTVNPATLKSPLDVAKAYVQLWNGGNFDGMYQLISTVAQSTISQKDFSGRYQGIDQEVGQSSIKVTINNNTPDDATHVPIHVARESGKVGHLEEDNLIPLVKDGANWRIDWTPSLIFADLGDGFVRWKPDVPQRGRILDRKGRPLAHLGTISKVGIVPGEIKDEAAMLDQLSQLLNMPKDTIKSLYANGQPDWFMPIHNYPDPMDPTLEQKLKAIPGIEIQKWPDRVYPDGAASAQVVGYLSQVTADELPELSKQGYSAGDMVGRAGIEAWGEKYLAGKRGGRLVIVGSDGSERKTLGEVKSEPSDDIVLTIDLDLQNAAFQLLADKPGSIVVLDPNSGAVLAMASNPSFDPNQFILGLSDQQWTDLNNPQTHPLQNRATQSAYPIGSTFKVVTMAAAMQSLGLTPSSTIPCPGSFTIPGGSTVWHDWSLTGQGTLTLHNALVQSCDTVFYKLGADLDTKDQNLLPNMARAFGFGKPTGIELPEVPGVVPDAEWKLKATGDYWARGDAVNLAIGQGYFLGTPLQVADAYAAIANGGTLWQPYVVQEVHKLDGTKVYSAQPKERGKLPITADQVGAIRSALKDVVSAPNGTAVAAFKGEQHPVAGKTGTAETNKPEPHSWFVSFTPVDGAKFASVTAIENAGEGGDIAAPIERQLIDKYYQLYP
ncbi:MAG TPA: penicillin-binding protein 2 [Nitrolancea sp.]|nr:penicillin-binding protein 2 [Nitrolancea sp.]